MPADRFGTGEMSKADYSIERLGSSDLPAVEALFNAVFPWKPVPPGFAAWRYASREIGGICVGVRESASGRVVAAHGVQLLPATRGLLIGLSVDVMVHPEHQRIGLGGLMEERVRAEAEKADCTLLMCFPNPKLARLRETIPEWEPALQARAYRLEGGFASPVAPRAWLVMANLPDQVEILWQALRKQAPDLMGIDRSRAYLAWRFMRHPVNRYQWILPANGEEVRGAAVTKLWVDPTTNVRFGDIVDLLALDPGSTKALLFAACEHLRSQSVSKITLWAPWTVTDEELTSCGFEPDPQLSRTLQVRYLNKRPRIDFSEWFLAQSDTDLY